MTATKLTATALAALTAATPVQTDTAEAGRRERLIGGIAAGLVVGTLIAGAAARERVIVSSDCGYLRDRALYNQDIGRPGRAQYWWDRYNSCLGR